MGPRSTKGVRTDRQSTFHTMVGGGRGGLLTRTLQLLYMLGQVEGVSPE